MELHATNQTGCKWKGDAESEDGGGGTGIDLSEGNGTREERGSCRRDPGRVKSWPDVLGSARALAARRVRERAQVDERQNGREKTGGAAAGWKLR